VLLYPEGMVTLNTSASEILKRCEDAHTVAEIVTDLKQHFPGADVEPDVLKFLEDAKDNGWVSIKEE
ncbi:MAG: pyrroloquinoline quinone biosynthesis peptide chaperone PqqD, partial [Candidatus Binatia bacterium]